MRPRNKRNKAKKPELKDNTPAPAPVVNPATGTEKSN